MVNNFKNSFFLLLCLLFNFTTQSQSISNFNDINFSELKENQIDLLLRRAAAQGFSQFDLLKIAKQQGMNENEISVLSKKFSTSETLSRVSESSRSPIEESRLRKQYKEKLEVFRESKSDVFGYDVFKGNTLLTFQSNLNIPTPLDYIIGPGDELFIDIYGASENYYQVEVNPEGDVILENIGPVSVTGLSLEEAKVRLTLRLKSTYTGINNSTFLNISVGVPRAIRVNIVGEVNLPGTYNFSAFNTVYNAIYVAGGITENATLRDIKLFRNNKLISSVDVYKFISKGDGTSNVRLENNDLILVGPYTNRVFVDGEVKIPGRFEIKNGESLNDLISYAGGLNENSYKKSIKLKRIVDDEYKTIDINSEQFEFFQPIAGDRYTIEKITEKYNNRVLITGSVYRPGAYSITENGSMFINELIEKAEGLKSDVFLRKAYITRTNKDYSTTNIAIDLEKELNNPSFVIQEDDIINILSKNDLNEETYIEISGEVNNPGILPFSKNLSLTDAILLSGGFSENASGNNVQISRRILDQNYDGLKVSEVLTFDITTDLNSFDREIIELKPFDQIIVRKNPNFYVQKYIRIEGEIMYPGKYAIESKSERISDLLKKAGGLKNFAYLKGATLLRLSDFVEINNDLDKKIEGLSNLRNKITEKANFLTESEILLIDRLNEDLKNLELMKDDNKSLVNYAKMERLNEIFERNSISNEISSAKFESIGIDLESIIKSPGSKSDLLLKEGDVIIIPKKIETVRLRGELLYPTTVRFLSNKNLKYFIDSAGGFDSKAKRSGTYVIYANGDVARTKKLLFFNLYPKVEPGCEVIVPKKEQRIPVGANQLLSITTGITTLILAINQIN